MCIDKNLKPKKGSPTAPPLRHIKCHEDEFRKEFLEFQIEACNSLLIPEIELTPPQTSEDLFDFDSRYDLSMPMAIFLGFAVGIIVGASIS